MPQRIDYIIAEIKDQYLIEDNNRPWIVGFSGGKDSTALLQLVWCAIKQLSIEQRKREVHVVCNDTLVENPLIQNYVDEILEQISNNAKRQKMPILVAKTIPQLEDNFWINVIGRGYPVPNNTFRWCTDRMKIKPTTRYILERVDEKGEAIVLVGTRRSESATRANSIKKHELRGKRLTKHPIHPNTFVYSPIKELQLEEVWYIINKMPSPWGADNAKLFTLYANASADDYECPTMVSDDKHRSCGQSRFGCWVCTVVKEDKSLTALVNNGHEWLKPMLDFRNWLFEGRNISENRETTRRNGQYAVTEDGHNQGNYTIEYRTEILRRLLEVQSQQQYHGITLISHATLVAIQVIWKRDLAQPNKRYKNASNYETVSSIYNKIYHTNLDMNNLTIPFQQQNEECNLLRQLCGENSNNYECIRELIGIQNQKSLLVRRNGLWNDIEQVIEKYLKQENDVYQES